MVTGRFRFADRWGGGWDSEAWVTDVPGPEHAWVVDSFLVDEGRVYAPEEHRDRFTRSCHDAGLDLPQERIARFWEAAWELLPASGRWFPRLEAHRGSRVHLVFWVREAPPLTSSVRLWVPETADPRSHPSIKGPDLAVLAGLRDDAIRHGADDAVLLNTSGTVLEAAHSGLLWWRGNTLCHPTADLPVLPSVTVARVLQTTRELGLEVRAEQCRWTDLVELEVWAANALHGIRAVSSWQHITRKLPVSGPKPDSARLARFRSPAPSGRHPFQADEQEKHAYRTDR